MKRRKFIIGAGSATTAGLAGCIDLVESNGDPNDNDDTEGNGNNNDNDGSNSNVELNFFTANVNCAGEDTDEFSSITNPEDADNLYEFSGRMIVPNTCQETNATVSLEEGTLTVDLETESTDTECEDECAGAVNFAGAAFVEDSVQVDESKINLP